MTKIHPYCSYYNPGSQKHVEAPKLFKKLDSGKKCLVIMATIFAAIGTFFMGGLGGAAVFRHLVYKWSKKTEPLDSTTSKVLAQGQNQLLPEVNKEELKKINDAQKAILDHYDTDYKKHVKTGTFKETLYMFSEARFPVLFGSPNTLDKYKRLFNSFDKFKEALIKAEKIYYRIHEMYDSDLKLDPVEIDRVIEIIDIEMKVLFSNSKNLTENEKKEIKDIREVIHLIIKDSKIFIHLYKLPNETNDIFAIRNKLLEEYILETQKMG